MSDPNTHRPDAQAPPVDARRSGPGALLWILLLLIAAALVWFFAGRRDAAPMPGDAVTPIGETTPVPSESPVSTAPASRERATSSPARTSPRRPADRDARAVNQPAPEYPATALRSREEGTVVVNVEVDASGKPTDVGLAKRSHSRDLDRAALAAVRGWTFEPAIRDGKPVASAVQVPVDFRLDTR